VCEPTQGIVGTAVFPFEGSDVGVNVRTASDGDGLRNRVAEEWRLRTPILLAKAPKPSGLEIINHTRVQVIGLHFSRDDSECRYCVAEILREAFDVIDDLIDASRGHDVRDGGDHVACRNP